MEAIFGYHITKPHRSKNPSQRSKSSVKKAEKEALDIAIKEYPVMVKRMYLRNIIM